MSTISSEVVDLKQGIVREIGKWTMADEEELENGVVEFSLEDDEQISISFADVVLFVPIDRLQMLLESK